MNKDDLYREIEKNKPEMTPGERMAAYFQGQEVDCIPHGLLAPDDAFANLWGYTKQMVNESLDVKAEIIERKKREYGIEGVHCCIGLRGIGEAVGSTAYYPENSTEYITEFFANDYSVLKHLDSINVYKNSFLSRKLNDTKQLLKRFPKMGTSSDIAGPLTTVIAMRPIEKVLRDMRKHPTELKQLIQYGVDCSLEWVKVFHEETGTTDFSISDPVTTTDILGQEYFAEYSKPYFKQLFDGIVQITGAKPSIHICGHSKKIWNDLAEIGVGCFSLDNCESLSEAKEIIGNKMFLSGNVAPVEAMKTGSIDDVIQAVIKCLEDASDNPCGFMLMTGCQVPLGTPQENIDAFYYAARKYGAGARLGKICKGLEQIK